MKTWLISCQSVEPQLKSPGLRAEGLSMATTSPKVTPRAPSPGMPSGAHGEVFVIGIDLNLNRAGKLHSVLHFVGGENRVQLLLHVGEQQCGFAFVELKNGRVVAKGIEVFVAVEQAKAVDGCGVAIAVVVSELNSL